MEDAVVILEEPLNPTLNITRKYQERSSWYEIADGIISGRARTTLAVGDVITCQSVNGKQISFDVADIPSNNEVFFTATDAVQTKRMNSRDTNRGGFVKSEMADWLDKVFYETLPYDLRHVISKRTIRQEIGDEFFERESLIWLPSIVEVSGEEYKEYECEKDLHQFELFKTRRNRCKDFNGSAYYWWLRSPYLGTATNFWYVSTYGTLSNSGATYAFAVVPSFSIRKI